MKKAIHVIRNSHGWWDVRNQHGDVLIRFVSEFQAVEAGRGEADRLGAELLIHPHENPEQSRAVRVARTRRRDPPGQTRPSRLILLVEDSLELREFYANYLTYAGFKVVTAINGHEALRLAKHLRPDLILMDIRMPGMDGLEATADLKRTPGLADIPVVAFTADLSPDVAARARHAGCIAFIAKPAIPDEVARRLAEVLESRAVG